MKLIQKQIINDSFIYIYLQYIYHFYYQSLIKALHLFEDKHLEAFHTPQ